MNVVKEVSTKPGHNLAAADARTGQLQQSRDSVNAKFTQYIFREGIS